jgi:hypothetical protein
MAKRSGKVIKAHFGFRTPKHVFDDAKMDAEIGKYKHCLVILWNDDDEAETMTIKTRVTGVRELSFALQVVQDMIRELFY